MMFGSLRLSSIRYFLLNSFTFIYKDTISNAYYARFQDFLKIPFNSPFSMHIPFSPKSLLAQFLLCIMTTKFCTQY